MEKTMISPPKARFLIDESGKTSAALVNIRDFKRLLAAWEEVADAHDFAAARSTASRFISTEDLRRQLTRKK